MELQQWMIEAFAVEESRINFEEKGTWPKPVVLSTRHDAELEELNGAGENLDVTREADLIRLKNLLKKKLKDIRVHIFGKNKNLKDEFDDLILQYPFLVMIYPQLSYLFYNL
eukprot:snap_masked-scaffold_7-processed-gene-14.38-mRNA-1 protein AED:1.00 eAED:1.00 QI:0/0/0/0/1/1/2/0/111